MKITTKIEGLDQLDKALSELPRAVQRRTLHKVLRQAAEPIREEAQRRAPYLTGDLRGSFIIRTSMKNKIGNAEFSAVMRAGGTRAEAGAAMREARRAAGQAGLLNFAQVFIGPAKGSKRQGIKAMVQEFGSIKQSPNPYMRPAWDTKSGAALQVIISSLGAAIKAAAARQAAKALRKPSGK